MLAATAALFAACAETDLVNEVNIESNSQEIGFSTFAGKLTRAENSYETDKLGLEKHHDNFKVWGYKNTTSAYVFDGVTVTAAATEGEWTYSPTKYWDKAANTYEFYAASPADAAWVLNENTTAQNDNYFIIDSYELKDETHGSTSYQESFKTLTQNKDLLIASPEKVLEYQILGAEKVDFEFNHILSRLNITVKKDADLPKVELKSISVKGLVNIASFSEKETANAAGSNTRWTKTNNTYNLTGNALATVGTDALYVLQSLVIPQDAEYQDIDRDGSSEEVHPYLYIEYTIGGEPFNATYNLANAFGVATKVAFNEGWQNTLNITIDADAIVFDAVTYKWEDVDPTDKVID